MAAPLSRVVETALPVDLAQTVYGLRRGGRRDPTARIGPDGMWRASRFASGPCTMHLQGVGRDRVRVRAWGEGADEAVAAAPRLVGADDGDGGLGDCAHPLVRDLARRHPGARLGATGNVLEALVPTIIEQKVQTMSAHASWCAMVRACREHAPDPGELRSPALLLPPPAAWLARQPSWAWHRWGVEQRRARTVRVAASYAHRFDPGDVARLRVLPGIGAWTVAEVETVVRGDPDAVSVGDFWLCHWVCHNLEGTARGSDERMLELLAPFRGQRGRVCRLIMLGGQAPPRFGPRLPLQSISGL